MLGYVHYRKPSPPPEPGMPAQSGFLPPQSGQSKSRLRWRIFIIVCIKSMIKMIKIIYDRDAHFRELWKGAESPRVHSFRQVD